MYNHYEVVVCFNSDRRIEFLSVYDSVIQHCEYLSIDRYVRSVVSVQERICLLCEKSFDAYSSLVVYSTNGVMLESIDIPCSNPNRIRVFEDIFIIAQEKKITAYDTYALLSGTSLRKNGSMKDLMTVLMV